MKCKGTAIDAEESADGVWSAISIDVENIVGGTDVEVVVLVVVVLVVVLVEVVVVVVVVVEVVIVVVVLVVEVVVVVLEVVVVDVEVVIVKVVVVGPRFITGTCVDVCVVGSVGVIVSIV